MNQLRAFVSAVLDKTSALLKSEPARAIGYGAAAAIFVVGKVLADRGYIQFNLTFEDSVVAATASLTLIGGVVESIRKFVYSPQTYIEDLADSFADGSYAGHEDAHIEMELHAGFEAAMAAARDRKLEQAKAADAEAPKSAVSIQTDKVQ